METAGEGGPWGMAVLAAYRVNKEEGETLEAYLENKVFAGAKKTVEQPVAADVAGFAKFIADYRSGLMAEKAAVEALPM